MPDPDTNFGRKKGLLGDFGLFELYTTGGRLERPPALPDRSGGPGQRWERSWACVWPSVVADATLGGHASRRITRDHYSQISKI